jgi:hypothetical protein
MQFTILDLLLTCVLVATGLTTFNCFSVILICIVLILASYPRYSATARRNLKWLYRLFLAGCIFSFFGFFVYLGCSDPREICRNSECINNLKQVGLGLLSYYDQQKNFPLYIR